MPSSGSRSFALPGLGESRRHSSSRSRKRLVARLRRELFDVDARRHLVHALERADDVLQYLPDVVGAYEDGFCRRQRGARGLGQLAAPTDRVLELRAVRLDRERRAGRGSDRSARQHVIAEDEIGWQALLDRRRVRSHVPVELQRSQILEQPRLEALVRVEDEHRQRAARQLRTYHVRPTEVEPIWLALLAEDRDLVPGPTPGSRDRLRVDVRAGARKEVPMPEQDPHAASLRPSRESSPKGGGSRGNHGFPRVFFTRSKEHSHPRR